MPFLFGRLDDERLAAVASSTPELELTYAEHGATRGDPPPGYRVGRHAIDLAPDEGSFARASEGLRQWAAHRAAGARVVPPDVPLEPGRDVVVALRMAPLATAVAPCRIVYVTDEPERFGFAYGSLEGHPEQGEEAFHVVRAGGATRFEIVVFSREAHPLARVGAPVARWVQQHITTRYLEGLRDFAS